MFRKDEKDRYYEGLSRGQAEITGVYVRPWMKYEDTSENRVHYSIEVK